MTALLCTSMFLGSLVFGHAAFTSMESRIPTYRKLWVVSGFLLVSGVLLGLAVAFS